MLHSAIIIILDMVDNCSKLKTWYTDKTTLCCLTVHFMMIFGCQGNLDQLNDYCK